MSAFGLFPSASPPTPDVADPPSCTGSIDPTRTFGSLSAIQLEPEISHLYTLSFGRCRQKQGPEQQFPYFRRAI